jgi:hypothetical protein
MNKMEISLRAICEAPDTSRETAIRIMDTETPGTVPDQLDALLGSIFRPFALGSNDLKDVYIDLEYVVDCLTKTKAHILQLVSLYDEIEGAIELHQGSNGH